MAIRRAGQVDPCAPPHTSTDWTPRFSFDATARPFSIIVGLGIEQRQKPSVRTQAVALHACTHTHPRTHAVTSEQSGRTNDRATHGETRSVGDNVAAGHTPRAFSLVALAGEVGSLARSLARFSTHTRTRHTHTHM